MKNRKKAFKAILAVLFLGIMMTGCSNHDKPATDPNGDVADLKETKDSDQKEFVMPTEVMSKEETDTLTEGQTISAEELKKLPDPLALENRGLAFVYVYTSKKDNNDYAYGKIIENMFSAEVAPEFEFKEIKILPIVEYSRDFEDKWYKCVTFKEGILKEGFLVEAGYVLSEEKINELNAGQQDIYFDEDK